MENDHHRINELFEKLEALLIKQDYFTEQINDLRKEIAQLKPEKTLETEPQKIPEPTSTAPKERLIESVSEADKLVPSAKPVPITKRTHKAPLKLDSLIPKINLDFEKFIGENLINKIGILITIIGVAIGAKYSIEHELISPLTRIILGYVMGLGLMGFGMKLKKNYESYSAVLLSGSMAIMYFITYAAYSFYGLFPQLVAFGLMLIFTVFTVLAALNYNRQVIAHIGLVGAYAVPFLLSSGTGQVAVLFSYVAIINVGILVISFRKYWKALYYVAFVLTWLIFTSWYVFDYSSSIHFTLAFTFSAIFFVTFYLIFLAFKLLQKKKFDWSDIFILLSNSFLFYGIGYSLLVEHEVGKQILGLFTLANGIIHFVVSSVIYKQKLGDRNLFYLVIGLVLVFITMAIPVQLDGNWVTMIWAGEAALLFWIGRTKQVFFYEKISYALMFLALFSLFQDWESAYSYIDPELTEGRMRPLLNINFLTSILCLAAFGFINYLNQNQQYPSPLDNKKGLLSFMSLCIPAIFLLILFAAFKMEIGYYWDQLFQDSRLIITEGDANYPSNYRNYDYNYFGNVWTVNYVLLFCALLSFVNIKKIKNQQLAFFNLILNVLAIFLFLSQGLYQISELRESYLEQTLSEYYIHGPINLWIRYISFVFVGLLQYALYKYIQQDFIDRNLLMPFDLLLHLALLWIASSELLHWMDFADSQQSYKLGLSILWGGYALLLVSLGIWKHKKYLRISGIAVFAVTLAKLFLYDLSDLNTIAKTIVFVSLGVLLLIISFLYNKYKHVITDEVEQ